MPHYLITEPPQSTAAQTWQTLFKNALRMRKRAEELTRAFRECQTQHRLSPSQIAVTLLGFRHANGGADDMLLFDYSEFLVKEKYLCASDLLAALLKHSSYTISNTAPTTRVNFHTCEERMFMLLTQYYQNTDHPSFPTTAPEIQDLVHAVYRWLKTASDEAVEKQLSGLQTVDSHLSGMYEHLARLALSTLGNNGMRNVMHHKWWQERRAQVVAALGNYDEHVLQWINSGLSGQLKSLVTMVPYLELDAKGNPKLSDAQILNGIEEVPSVRSRAGMFIWLSAALAARPLTDDMTLLSYLQGRYSNDPHSLVVDLLVASFDVLTNVMLTKEPNQNVKIVRSFICNKVPVLISMVASTMQPPIATESCIHMALMPGGMISMDPLPPISAGATQVRDTLKTTRLEFLQACVLHNLITEQTVAQILQEPVALPRIAKLNKDNLVAQCTNNISKLSEHIEDLAGMQGNVGAIAGCLIETVNNLCMSKDNMTLKSLCDKLIKRISNMDFVLQYAQPGALLLPLCNLLHDWPHEQDQNDFTPNYEEFASILLFTLAVMYRYDLSYADIGIHGESYVAKLQEEMKVSRPLAQMQSEQQSQLAQWIEGLFVVDEQGDTSGIGDEVMRQCSPQAFYTLVPTLFEQSVLACRSKQLSMSAFKSGLELLLEPFLLPSLIMGLGWLAEHSWEDHNDADVLIQVLDKLLKPASNAPETQAMHRAVLAMVATPIYNSLEEYTSKHPNKKATELLELLKPHLNQQRAMRCRQGELQQWEQASGSLEGRVQQTIRDLVTWSTLSTSPPNPPPQYTAKTFAVACQLLDSEAHLKLIISEINRTDYAYVPVVLDVCTSLICAPAPVPVGEQQATHWTSPTGRLRSRVRLESTNAQGLLEMPNSYSESLVRLGRRVEAQMSFAPHIPAIANPIQDQATDQIMQDFGITLDNNAGDSDLGAAMATNTNAIASNAEISAMDHIDLSGLNNTSAEELSKLNVDNNAMNIDQSNPMFADFGLNVGDPQQTDQSGGMANQDEDIFAGTVIDPDFAKFLEENPGFLDTDFGNS